MKEILVAADFSENAADALKYALHLARVLHVHVDVIHAIHPTEGINNSTYNAIFIEDYYHNKREALKEWVAACTPPGGHGEIHIRTICEVGFLKNVIKNHIKANQVDFLVMGITGATGIAGIVGSNASMIVSKIKIPTLFIPRGSTFPNAPAIALATDFETRLSAGDVNALKKLIQAAQSPALEVVYVADDKPLAHQDTHEHKLQDLFDTAELHFNYVTDASAPGGIINFIEARQTDILCLVKHQHNVVYRLFTRSTVNQVLNKSLKAVLILHE